MDNIAQNHGIISDCDPYLLGGGENLRRYLRHLIKACKCDYGPDRCKELDLDLKDGYLTCKQTASDACRRCSKGLFDVWDEVPKEEDEYCTNFYNKCKNLDDSCN